MTGPGTQAAETGTAEPHPARRQDRFLDGKDGCPVDEQMVQQLLALDTGGRDMARADRAFPHRATRRLAGSGVPRLPGLGPVEPGVPLPADRRPEPGAVVEVPGDEPVPGCGGVARKR
ncbi:SAM-dependent methyltransferase [Streptomyces sp.]|uniref:SAM-dependent methyltransferase n=1 Tax=Streptomyces sp. TaxID=1931 RepID=UPI0039C8D629